MIFSAMCDLHSDCCLKVSGVHDIMWSSQPRKPDLVGTLPGWSTKYWKGKNLTMFEISHETGGWQNEELNWKWSNPTDRSETETTVRVEEMPHMRDSADRCRGDRQF